MRDSVEIFASRYSGLADWSVACSAPTAATMVNALRKCVKEGGLTPLYVIIDEYEVCSDRGYNWIPV